MRIIEFRILVIFPLYLLYFKIIYDIIAKSIQIYEIFLRLERRPPIKVLIGCDLVRFQLKNIYLANESSR